MGIEVIFAIAILIMSVVIHEVSHGYSAYLLGDPTAKYADRLTLNPLKHLDMMGSVFLPLILVLIHSRFLFGWAKPVPYNPYNLKNQKWGPAIVSVSGPGANALVSIVFGIGSKFIPLSIFAKNQIAYMTIVNFSLQGGDFLSSLFSACVLVVWINVLLMVFNLVPIPPLDGSKVLFSVLPYRWHNVQVFLERYGFFILLFFIFFFFQLLLPIIYFLFTLITGIQF